MIYRYLISLLIWIPCFSFASEQPNQWPADVAEFMEQRSVCDHFRGEEAYDEERRKFLERNIIEWCTGMDNELAYLKEKYQGNSAVIERLLLYEEDIEPNN